MKFMNNHYGVSRIFCAPSATDGQSGGTDEEAGDDQDGEDESEEDGGDDESEEKKYTEKDIEDVVKRRLARERRKWQRQQQRPEIKTNSGDKAGKTGNEETEAERKAREAEEKASALELKWTCMEHDVKKDCVDDVLALAKVHVSKDSSVDIEDAIDKVLEKYPQFKDGYDGQEEEEDSGEKKRGWGQRHGKSPKKSETVEDEIRKQLFGK